MPDGRTRPSLDAPSVFASLVSTRRCGCCRRRCRRAGPPAPDSCTTSAGRRASGVDSSSGSGPGRAGPVRGRRRVGPTAGRGTTTATIPGCRASSRAADPDARGRPARRLARRAGASVPGRGGPLPAGFEVRAPLRRPGRTDLDERLRQGPRPRAVRRGGAGPAGARRSGRGPAAAGAGPRVGLAGAADAGRRGDRRQARSRPCSPHRPNRSTGRLRLAHDLGALLAAFHGQDVPPRLAGWSPSDAARLAGRAAAGGPDLRRRDGRPGGRAAGPAGLPVRRPPPPRCSAHGGFRAGQVVVVPGRAARASSTPTAPDAVTRAADLGTALAHLRWQAIRPPGQRPALLRAEQALLAGYVDRAGVADRERSRGGMPPGCCRWRSGATDGWRWPVGAAARARRAAADLLASDRPPGHVAARGDRPARRPADDARAPAGAGRARTGAHARRGRVGGRARAARTADGAWSGTRSAGSTAPGRCTVVGKRFDRAASRAAAPRPPGPARTRAVRRRPSPGPGPGGAPVPHSGLVVYRRCEGTAAAPGPVARRPPCAMPAVAARWLARLHTSDVRLPADVLPRPGGAEHPGVGDAHRGPAPRPGRPGRRARAPPGQAGARAGRAGARRCRSTRTSIPGTCSSVTTSSSSTSTRPGTATRPSTSRTSCCYLELLSPAGDEDRSRLPRGVRRRDRLADPGTYDAFSPTRG